MVRQVDLRIVELLAARLCHELISPIGAIANGIEFLGEDDPEFVRDATTLIEQSARKAAQRLQFYRFAYGSLATGSATDADPRALIDGLLDGGKLSCDWPEAASKLPAEWQKLACNMVVLVTEALPRGGKVAVAVRPGIKLNCEVMAEGEAINLTDEARAALALEAGPADLTARTVQGHFTARLAGTLGAALSLAEPGPGRLGLIAATN